MICTTLELSRPLSILSTIFVAIDSFAVEFVISDTDVVLTRTRLYSVGYATIHLA